MKTKREKLVVGGKEHEVNIRSYESISEARKTLDDTEVLKLINYAFNLVQRARLRAELK